METLRLISRSLRNIVTGATAPAPLLASVLAYPVDLARLRAAIGETRRRGNAALGRR